MTAANIRQEIYRLVSITNAKEFRELFPEFKNYRLKVVADLLDIKLCLESQPESIEKILEGVRDRHEAIDLIAWRIKKEKLTVTDAISQAIYLNKEIQSDCEEILAWSKSVRF